MMVRADRDAESSAIMEMIATVIVYKFKNLSRDEVYSMLNYTIDELKETRFYREVSEEARAEGRTEGQQTLLLTLLNTKFGSLSLTQQTKIQTLPIDRIQSLSVALFNFNSIEDLNDWLNAEKA